MRKHQIENISWQEVLWQRPYDLEAVQNILAQLANLTPRRAVIWEIRGRNGHVSHLHGRSFRYCFAGSRAAEEKGVVAARRAVLRLVPGFEQPRKDTH